MKIGRLNIALITILLLASTAQARGIEEEMQSLIARTLPADKVAVYAESLNGGDPLIDINGDVPMTPASCVKLVTAAAALAELGVDYRFVTEFLSDAKPAGTIIDTLYIRGNGDPFVTPQVMWRMAGALIDHGYHRIRGDVIIDQSFFDGYDYPYEYNGGFHAYEAPTAAVAANFNVVEFIVTPGSKPGSTAHVSMQPNAPYIQMINRVKTGKLTRIGATRQVTDDREIFVISGEIRAGSKPTSLARSISRPVRFAGSLFAELLKQNGIGLDGSVREGTVPPGAYPLFEIPSPPLALLVRDMNKFSSNFIAEQITKHVGGRRTGRPGTTVQGLMAIREWLRSIGVSPRDYVLENGSGLSGASKLSAQQLVHILRAAGNDPAFGPDFMSSLSILGVDGTMSHWHAEPEARGILRAKTGTLKDVANLVGYIPGNDGSTIAFAIMAQGLKIGINDAREAEVKIAQTLAKRR